jgi:hypothetical protein
MSLHARLGQEAGIRTAVDDCLLGVAGDPQRHMRIAEGSAA